MKGCQISPFHFFALYFMLLKKCYSDRNEIKYTPFSSKICFHLNGNFTLPPSWKLSLLFAKKSDSYFLQAILSSTLHH